MSHQGDLLKSQQLAKHLNHFWQLPMRVSRSIPSGKQERLTIRRQDDRNPMAIDDTSRKQNHPFLQDLRMITRPNMAQLCSMLDPPSEQQRIKHHTLAVMTNDSIKSFGIAHLKQKSNVVTYFIIRPDFLLCFQDGSSVLCL